MNFLNSKIRCDYIINILLYSDFSAWPRESLKEIVELFSEIETENCEQNIVSLLYNPILSLALASEILGKIGKASSIFTRFAKKLSTAFQNIGLKLALQLSEDLIDRVYMDTDFKGRTVLRIAVDNKFELLIKCLKIDDLVERLWTGRDTFDGEGKTNYYSKLYYMNETNQIRFLPGKDFTIRDLINQNFEAQIESENYWFQFDYRRYSIRYIFAKDFISALALAFITQLVNLEYISMFVREKFVPLPFEEQYAYVQTDLDQYQRL